MLKGMGCQEAIYVDDDGKKNENNEACVAGEKYWNREGDIVVPTKIQEPSFEHEQQIPSYFSPSDTLLYENEIQVQVYVQQMALDAIRCLGYEGDLTAHMETSFYGIAPDIIIVTHQNKFIFVMEVKSPDKPQKDGDEEDSRGGTRNATCHIEKR